jgi:hypothetical protein
MNVVDVYDLGSKKWTKQSTDGPSPKYRVNPCAVVGSAQDGSSHNVYLFGGQNLVPYAQQLQYDDMYILTVPAFKWIKVDQKDQPVPPARAGHTCDIVGSQMIVIGGYAEELSCDSPGFYVFDASKLEWRTGYSAKAGGFNNNDGKGGYKVPRVVIDAVGGNEEGGATVKRPVKAVDADSPMVTAQAGDYKYATFGTRPIIAVSTASDGTVTTSTVTPKPDEFSQSGSGQGPNIGAIVGGVIGGILFVVTLAFASAFLLYKKKIREIRENQSRMNQGDGTGYYKAGEAGRLVIGGGHHSDNSGGVGGENHGSTSNGSSTDLNDMLGEPTFWGVLLSPRRTLRVVN